MNILGFLFVYLTEKIFANGAYDKSCLLCTNPVY